MAGMLKNSGLWLTLGGVSTASALYLARGLSLSAILGLSKPGGIWRLLAMVFGLLNLKGLPFGWHARLFYGLISHVSLFRHRPPPSPGPTQLFQPVITSSRTTFTDLDYNLHKSNSTYFADLDISRMHLVACVFALGTHRARFGMEGTGERPKEPGVPSDKGGSVGVYLGGVTCNFRKELKPYEAFEIYTRLLCWDRKWIYLVSHIVKAGAVKPGTYTMQPWKNKNKAAQHANDVKQEADPSHSNGAATTPGNGSAKASEAHPAIIATSIAKYVFKRGRWTIPPEVALENSGLLPPRPSPEQSLSETQIAALTDANGEVWDWDRVERERARGMEVAQHMAGLDALMAEFPGDGAAILGRW